MGAISPYRFVRCAHRNTFVPMSARARRLHQSPWQGVLHATGGGAGLLAEMLGEAGASRTVLEASVPYSAASLAELLGVAPEQACSGETARAMAMVGYQRARGLGASRPFGFGVTASLATDRSKRGPCRAHIALQTEACGYYGQCAEFAAADNRAAQERELVDAAWQVLLAGLGLVSAGDVEVRSVRAAPEWQALLAGKLDAVQYGASDATRPDAPETLRAIRPEAAQTAPSNAVPADAPEAAQTTPHQNALLFPGSFNPLHDGHRRMMAHAEARLGERGAFELSIENVDKPLLDYIEIQARLRQFEHPVWLTRLPRFVDKARRFPNATFVVGIDTLVRIADPAYYGGERERDRQLGEMLGLGARFLVFGRLMGGVFQGLADHRLPAPLAAACTGVGESDFRLDISSSEIRSAALRHPR